MTTVSSGSVLVVSSGQTASNIDVLSGGYLLVDGTVTSTTIEPSNPLSLSLQVYGGTAISTTIGTSHVWVTAGARIIDTTINGDTEVDVWGSSTTASYTMINSGSVVVVGEYLAGGGGGGLTFSSIINSGGHEIVGSGGTDIGTAVNSGGQQAVEAGGAVSNTIGNYQVDVARAI